MKKIRIGVLGCSNFLRKRIIDAVSKSRYAEIACLSSRDLEKAKKWAEEFKIENYDDYEGLLKRKDIDAIYIALPVGLHREWAIKAANAGKNILCEKSLAANLAEVMEIVDSCKKNKVNLMENIAVRYHPQHSRVLDIIEKGDLGKLFSFKSSFGFPSPGEGDIRYKKELGGGILNDVACYLIFMSRFLFKEEPGSVFCSVNIDKNKLIDTSGSFLLEFPENKKASSVFTKEAFAFFLLPCRSVKEGGRIYFYKLKSFLYSVFCSENVVSTINFSPFPYLSRHFLHFTFLILLSSSDKMLLHVESISSLLVHFFILLS